MKQMSKKLIVYYSMDGNTKMIAKMIHEKTGADMVVLNTVIPYTGTDEEIVQQGREEVNRGHLPDLEPLPVHLAEYDTIILGTPTWWYTMAPAVHSFIRRNNLSGKTVIPFQTHAVWPGHTLQDIEAAAKGAQVRNGKQIQFSAQEFGKLVTPEKEVREWIETL